MINERLFSSSHSQGKFFEFSDVQITFHSWVRALQQKKSYPAFSNFPLQLQLKKRLVAAN